MPKQSKPNQVAAIESLLDFARGTRPPSVDAKTGELVQYPAVKGLVLFGGVGTGKTHIAAVALRELKHAETLIVVPSCGGVVIEQWVEELDDAGVKAVFVYHGERRAERLAQFRADHADAHRCVVTTAHTLHADVSALLQASVAPKSLMALVLGGGKKKARARAASFTKEQWSDARWKAARNFGGFQCLVVDELQEFRNGSPPHDARKEVDETKSLYPTLDRFVAHARPSFVVGLSATPVVNSSGDIYSFTRWFRQGEDYKRRIMEKSRRGGPDDRRDFLREAKELRVKHFVKVQAPPCPPTVYDTVEHGYGPEEAKVLFKEYGKLRVLASSFYRALTDWLKNRNDPAATAKKDRLKVLFFAQVTFCKRLTIAPLVFNRPIERADPEVDPSRDAHGAIIRYEGDDGDDVILGKPLPFPCERVKAEVPLASISKFQALVDELRSVTSERVMIVSEYSDPLDMLKMYIEGALPTRKIYMFHGGVYRRDRELANFKESANDSILLATRGACGMAVNVECTTLVDAPDGPLRMAVKMYKIDSEASPALRDQCEGRVKRCLAQGWPSDADRVREYYVKTVRASKEKYELPTLEDWLEKVMKAKGSKAGDLLIDPEGGDANAGSGDSDALGNTLLELVDTFKPYCPAPKAKSKNVSKKRVAPAEGGEGSSSSDGNGCKRARAAQ